MIVAGFAISVLLNAFLLGVVAGKPSHDFGKYPPPPPPNPAQQMHQAAMGLNVENQAKVLKILEEFTPQIDEKLHQGMSGFANIQAVLMAKDIDEAEVKQTFLAIAAHHEEAGALMAKMFTDIAVALPDPQQRELFFSHAFPPEPPHFKEGDKKMKKIDRKMPPKR